MSHIRIDHSPDLKKLRDEGYKIEIKEGYLLIHNIPYIKPNKEIDFGILITNLTLAGDITAEPNDHVIHFIGEHPSNSDGSIISGIKHTSGNIQLAEGIVVNHSFSNKPMNRMYKDYYEKVTTYVKIISSQAENIKPNVTAKTFEVIKSDEAESQFNYVDTNSSRAEIITISSKVKDLIIGIIGLGGTGSYVLDFVSKTPVKEIRLYDGDIFLSHNAFRTPGAASIESLAQKPLKVSYLKEIYSRMHKKILAHEYFIKEENLDELNTLNFVFICIDEGTIKKRIIEKLIENKIPFVDVGIGINLINNALSGSARITAYTMLMEKHLDSRISYSNGGNELYTQNIQIAEINSLNAALAVIKWKKIFNIYHDSDKEHNTFYDIYTNKLINEDYPS